MGTVKDSLYDAIKYNRKSLILMLDFLLNEKKVIQLSDSETVIELYLLEKHRPKMNTLLSEYIQKRKHDTTWICKGLFDD
jgi:hypothetical protein